MNGLVSGEGISSAVNDGLNMGWRQAAAGAVLGAVTAGISAAANGKKVWTGRDPYYEASLDGFENCRQYSPTNCKDATLEAIEQLNGGSRTQGDFSSSGAEYLRNNPNATLPEYFEHYGFKILDAGNASYDIVGQGLNRCNPTVVVESVSATQQHTLTITRIRQWTPNSSVKVWFADPSRGIWKGGYDVLRSARFTGEAYNF